MRNRLKYLKIVLGLLFFTIATEFCRAEISGNIDIDAVNEKFRHERLLFDLHYKGMKAATSNMWIEQANGSTTIFWQAKTKSLASLLFKIDNVYTTQLDAQGRLMQTTKRIDQKNISSAWLTRYDWTTGMARSNQNFEWPIHPASQNVLAMLYDVRTHTLNIGDSISYILDIEGQIWRLTGIVDQASSVDGNLDALDIVFTFQPAMAVDKRVWKTDLLTNRLARRESTLILRFGPAPERLPLLLAFGDHKNRVEMILSKHHSNGN